MENSAQLSTAIDNIDSTDPISAELSFSIENATLSNTPLLIENIPNHYCTRMAAIHSKSSSSLSPEKLSKLWHIGLKTAENTIKATTHQCVCTTGLLTKRFKTDKAMRQYKQLSRRYGPFYVDCLKMGVTSVRQYIGGTLYTDRLGFKKFYPCTCETSAETGSTLRSFVDMVGLPPSLHSDNHGNFKKGLFKKLLWKFGIPSTYTEPHLSWQNRAEGAIGEVK